jgi:hypothetical protein
VLSAYHWCHALVPPPLDSRRLFVKQSVTGISAFVATTTSAMISSPATHAWALDMNAFENSQLRKSDQPTLLSADEGLCRYGAPGKETGDACVRAGISTKRTGTLDAFGTVDRGDFVRCKAYYDDKGDRYEKRVVCE